jgi:4-diphosphocytidyl-2-C-methyl-D-erythritol kinase
VITFSNCKINLGLHVVRKRTDGYHDLETVFYPLPLQDIVEVVRMEQSPVQFSASGIAVDAPPGQNLCIKAYELVKRSFDLPPVQMHLHKTIPAGAGLGGGSANAAFTLRLLNSKFNLGLSVEQLLDLALQLGSDCPFFIVNKPCMATGRGELLEPVELPQLSSHMLVIVNPGIHIATSWAFAQVNPGTNGHSIREIISQPAETWKHELVNVFEEPVFRAHPAIAAIKDQLYHKGAVYASMSGSGSTVFGLFKSEPVLEFPEDYMVKIIITE